MRWVRWVGGFPPCWFVAAVEGKVRGFVSRVVLVSEADRLIWLSDWLGADARGLG